MCELPPPQRLPPITQPIAWNIMAAVVLGGETIRGVEGSPRLHPSGRSVPHDVCERLELAGMLLSRRSPGSVYVFWGMSEAGYNEVHYQLPRMRERFG